jgi:ABC-type nitrate/sulfonate/bicarbonate transport system permease component
MDTQTMAAAILTLAIVAVGFDMIVAAAFGFITRWRRPARV